MYPLVSVIMPAYNAEKYIGQAIESILNQSYRDLELVIIEDCSQDGTLDIIEEYVKRDSRIKLLVNDCNRGISYSTNKGIDFSKGKYIALLDDDDIAALDRIRLQVDYMENNVQIDVLGGRSRVIDAYGKMIGASVAPRNNPKLIKAILHFRCMDFRNGTAMFRRSFIEKNGLRYQEDCYGMQDYKFYIDCSKVGQITTIDEILLYYRKHENNETLNRMRNFEEARKRKYAEFQRESLQRSGFCLKENNIKIINAVITEREERPATKEEILLLYDAFKEIMHQAEMMHIDYYKELDLCCRQLMAGKIEKMIDFKNDGIEI